MAEILLISDVYIKKYTNINGAVDPNLLYPSIYLAQDKHLAPYLGTALYEKIKNDIENNTLAGRTKHLLRITPAELCCGGQWLRPRLL